MEKKEIVSYDYKTFTVRREVEGMAADAFEALGWSLVGTSVSIGAMSCINLSFKRDRRINNKQELLHHQERIERTLQIIDTLHNKKRSAGVASSIATGVIGTLIFGGGMSIGFELYPNKWWVASGIVLGVLGLAYASTAWFMYKLWRKRKSRVIDPLLEDEYNKLADYCEATNKLRR